MALLTKKEFAEQCGMETKKLSVYIKRGKVILTGDKFDSENVMNIAFMEKQKANARKKAETKITPEAGSVAHLSNMEVETPPKQIKKETKTPESRNDHSEIREQMAAEAKLKTSKIKEETARIEAQTRIFKIQEEKLLGKMIPTDVIKSLFAQHFKSMTTSFKDAVDVIVGDFSKRAKLNRNEVAEFKGEMIAALNTATGNAIAMSNRQIGTIVSEYSQAKK